MNNVINFTVNINGNATKVSVELDDTVRKLVKSVTAAGNSFDRLGMKAFNFDAITNVVNKVSQAFQSLVGSSLDFEQQQANLKTLLNGDAEATESLVKQIREYGKATVYDKSGLVEAQKTMMTFGLDAEFAFGKLKNIGDIALGDKQKMNSLALAFSQATSSGKLMGQDLMQMINAGFNPLEVISQKTGKSMATLKDEMSKGGISAEMLAQSLEWATEEGGRFYKGAENAAETTAGKIAKVNGAIDDLKMKLFEATNGATAWIAEMGNMMVPISQMIPLLDALVKGVGKSMDWCSKQWSKFMHHVRTGVLKICIDMEVLKSSIRSAGGFFPWLALQAKIACRGISVAIMNIPIIGWIAAAVAAVIAVVTLLWNKSEGFRRVVFGVFESVKAIVHNVWVVIKAVAEFIWEGILKPKIEGIKIVIVSVWGFIKVCIDWIVSAAKTLWEGIVNVAKSIGDFFVGVWDNIVSVAQTVWDTIVEVATSIGDFFADIWDWVVEKFQIAIDWIVQKLSTIGSWLNKHIFEPIRKVFSKIWDFIKGILDKIIDKLKRLLQPIIDLWNKVFKKDQLKSVSEAYKEGAEKGSESWQKSQKEKTQADTEVLEPKATGAKGVSGGKTSDGTLGNASGTVAGKVQQIHITLGNMVGTMNFNGGLLENKGDVERQLTEMMARILGMAETAA